MKKRLGFVGVIIENRKTNAQQVNKILSEYGDLFVARVGLPYHDAQSGVITLVINATTDELGALTGKLGAIDHVIVKSALTKASKEE